MDFIEMNVLSLGSLPAGFIKLALCSTVFLATFRGQFRY